MQPYRHKVQYYETDKMQITHHSNYLRFMEEARTDFLEQIGWGYDEMEQAGISSPVIEVGCRYLKSTTYPDVVEIVVTVAEVTAVKLKLAYRMQVGENLVCTAQSSHCFMENGRPINLKKRLPAFYTLLCSLQQEEEKKTAKN